MTLQKILEKHKQQQKITCLTAYDASFSAILERSGIDVILVGDSLGMVIQGHKDTLSVTMDDMVATTANVRRGAPNSFIMADMPFLSYPSKKMALKNAGRLLRESGADMVKIEGGAEIVPIVQFLSQHYIPLCCHIGLKPQQVRQSGGYYRQGKTPAEAQQIIDDALALKEAGGMFLLLECVESTVAGKVRKLTKMPTIGIGSGADCDGQVLVIYDILGISKMLPWFSKNFMQESENIEGAVTKYAEQVSQGAFPPQK